MHRRPTMLRGATGTVRVERDDAGVAHVSADDLADAMLGLGHCHAIDRGLQILFVRTLGRGRGSLELRATDELLVLDRFFRRMNFGADVAEELAALSPRARAVMEAYCRGVDL